MCIRDRNLAEQGIRVSVVEGAGHVMPPMDMDMAHAVHNYIRAQGIGLYLGHTCASMDKDGVILDNGARVPADMVITVSYTHLRGGSRITLIGRNKWEQYKRLTN